MHWIEFNLNKQKNLQDFKAAIKQLDGLPVKKINIYSLTYDHHSNPIHEGCGVYLFRREKEIYYVGKCSKMSFVERIPKHFDTRPKAWFNHLLKRLAVSHGKKNDFNRHDLESALKVAMHEFNLVLINFRKDKNGHYDHKEIDRLESLLRRSTECINQIKTNRYLGDDKVEQLITG